MCIRFLTVLFAIVFTFSQKLWAAPNMCSFSIWEWNTKTKRAENHRTVNKSKSQLMSSERDPHSPCTVCEEDQEWIRINGILPFRICKHFAEQVRGAIVSALERGFPIHEVVGYRVGKSKGTTDGKGMRTKYSHHSFGTAVDVNSKFNGLYDNCTVFSTGCELLRGGKWAPKSPAAIKKSSPVYSEFQKIGWQWGGELKGKLKDFMHFSITGD